MDPMNELQDDELQKAIKEYIAQADEEALRAIYTYLAPIELSLLPEQDATLRGYTEPTRLGEVQYYSWMEMKAAIDSIATGQR